MPGFFRGSLVGLVAFALALGFDAVGSASSPPPCGPGQAWLGYFGDGVGCMDANGIHTYDEADSPIDIGQTHDIATCGSRTWIADSGGLVSTDGTTWQDYESALGYKTPEAVACDPNGGVWLGGYDLIAHFDGVTLQTYPIAKLGTGTYVKSVKDVAVSRTGVLWVTTSNSVARYSGSSWSYWQQGKGFATQMWFDQIAVDTRNIPWVSTGSYIYKFSGGKWVKVAKDFLSQPEPIHADAWGRVWIGTWAKGVAMYNGSTWQRFTHANSPLPSDRIRSITTDKGGRIWFGTDYGVSIRKGSVWKTYQMHNSDLSDNELYALGVVGKGPTLPPQFSVQTGKLTGRLLRYGKPVSGWKVQACVQYVGFIFTGSTPCADQVYFKTVSTATTGRFTFSLRHGKYALVFRTAAGKWVRLTDGFNIGDRQMLVPAGGVIDIGDIETTDVS